MALACKVPFELVDTIIDDLFESHQALASCALVCHAFRAIAQKHLFSKIIIKPGPAPPPSKDGTPPPTPSQILATATSPLFEVFTASPHLIKHVREVEIYFQRKTSPNYEDSGTQYYALVPTFTNVLPLVAPYIRSFTLSGCSLRPGQGSSAYCACVDWFTFPARVQRALQEITKGPNLLHIGIGFIQHVPRTFIPDIGSGKLESVTSQSMIWNLANPLLAYQGDEAASTALAKRGGGSGPVRRLTNLNLLARYPPVLQNIVDAMFKFGLIEGIETLSVSIQQGTSTTGGAQNDGNICTLIGSAAETLQHLYINIFEGPSVNWNAIIPHSDFNLSRLRRLRSFHRRVSYMICADGRVTPEPLGPLIDTLSTVPGEITHLEVFLDVTVYLSDESSSLRPLNWRRVALFFATRPYWKLTIRLQCSEPSRHRHVLRKLGVHLRELKLEERLNLYPFTSSEDYDGFQLI